MAAQVDLSNCAQEPIHIPGAIQPHGALLAFRPDGMLAVRSRNAASLLGAVPELGQTLGAQHLTAEARETLSTALAHPKEDAEPGELELGGVTFDIILHRADGLLVAEFEKRSDDAPPLDRFALKAQRTLERIQRQRDVKALLERAVIEVRELTGFDRVMAYQFRHDDSGDVVAEAHREGLPPYLGQRYPASDIPSQARRLYVLNPLRLIADISYHAEPLEPVLNPLTQKPLDLSHSVLRSVSPIHVEYLTNMGVGASMSVSIVVEGRLWGLIACHHLSPRVVPYAVRMACNLLSNMIGVLVERTETERLSRRLEQTSSARLKLIEAATTADDIGEALVSHAPSVRDLVDCDGVAVSLNGRVHCKGAVPTSEALAALVAWLQQHATEDVFSTQHLASVAPGIAALMPKICGVLAARFHRKQDGLVLWFREEQIENIRWGGKPEKIESIGPNGARLTPRGSFEAWQDTVRGESVPFTRADLEVAAQLGRELQEVSLGKAAELQRARDLFMAALGHDLRNPLHAISMSAEVLQAQGNSSSERISSRIAFSSRRMQRLLDQMLDVSKLQSGLGLGIKLIPFDLVSALTQVATELEAGSPGTTVEVDMDHVHQVTADPDRLLQVVANLLSNARHHGDLGKPIKLMTRQTDTELRISVSNQGPEIPLEERAKLFQPFKAKSTENQRNRGGMGLGLYISNEIVRAHHGRIDVDSQGGITTFTVVLPR